MPTTYLINKSRTAWPAVIFMHLFFFIISENMLQGAYITVHNTFFFFFSLSGLQFPLKYQIWMILIFMFSINSVFNFSHIY